MKFFQRQSSYINFDLPKYIDFKNLLLEAQKIASPSLKFDALSRAKGNDKVNHTFFTNKDGRLGWRKLEIINPLLYSSLVSLITEEDNWLYVKNRLLELQTGSLIACVSMPVLPFNKKSQAASQIIEWLQNVEKTSIKMSLNYNYVFVTDITDCYSSIYTHSISWALHDKQVSKTKRKFEELLGNKIDHHIQAMRYGQTNGIPQGSILMDFISEIVLAYVDREVTKRLRDNNIISGFEIIRYRDDYRIFTKTAHTGERIMKILSVVLAELGLRLNTNKTKMSNDIISNSIKADKLYFLSKDLKKNLSSNELRNQLILTYSYSKEFPNSGQLKSRLKKLLNIYVSSLDDDPEEYVSILTNIALDNPSSIPEIVTFISKVIEPFEKSIQLGFLDKIRKKLNAVPNSGFLEVWLQRLTIKLDTSIVYKEPLCNYAVDSKTQLFDNTWINNASKEKKMQTSYLDSEYIANMPFVVPAKEINLFRDLIPS